MIYVSRSSSGDFLESWPDLAKFGVWKGEIWQFGFSQGPGGAGIHPGGFVLMSGPQKPNYFPIWAIWGSVRTNFPILSYYLGVPPGPLLAPIGSYWLLLALVAPIGPIGSKSAIQLCRDGRCHKRLGLERHCKSCPELFALLKQVPQIE